MPFLKATVNCWESEKQEWIESERLFDILEHSEKLVLLKRKSSVFTRAIPALIFAIVWPVLNWHIYQSPVNHGTWVGWVILWCLIVPLLALPYIRQGWQVRKGDVWIIDGNQSRLERNGVLVAIVSQLDSVRMWQEVDGEGIAFSRLVVVPKQGKQIIIGDYGNTNENWQELTVIARLIAKYTQLPMETQPIQG